MLQVGTMVSKFYANFEVSSSNLAIDLSSHGHHKMSESFNLRLNIVVFVVVFMAAATNYALHKMAGLVGDFQMLLGCGYGSISVQMLLVLADVLGP